MRAAGKAWLSVIVLVAGIALLPGLLYLLGLMLVEGWPQPADQVPSGVAGRTALTIWITGILV